MTRCLQNLVQPLKPQAAEFHARAQFESTRHDLLCQTVLHPTLHNCLGKVALGDCEDVI